MENASFLTVLTLSFAVALTGAMSPGPLLTYTIVKSAEAPRRGYLMGTWIIAGHAAIEAIIILLLLAGFSFILKHDLAVRIIGVAGGIVLIFFGVSVIRDVLRKKVTGALGEEMADRRQPSNIPVSLKKRLVNNPVTGGALVSMANPYWWVWWATIGFAFMTEFNVTYKNIPGLAAFFIGHEAGDLAWYLIVSALSFWGIRRVNDAVYAWLLSGCGAFMIMFGIYLGTSPFL